MTPRQLQALDYIEAYHRENRMMPSLGEIQAALGLAARSGAHRVVDRLVAGGHLIRTRRGARSIALPAPADLTKVPTEALQAELERRATATIRGAAERIHAIAAQQAENARKGTTHG